MVFCQSVFKVYPLDNVKIAEKGILLIWFRISDDNYIPFLDGVQIWVLKWDISLSYNPHPQKDNTCSDVLVWESGGVRCHCLLDCFAND